MLHLILYTKAGCHLCEGLEEKLAQITEPPITIDRRDITTNEEWYATYQYEVPVLYAVINGQVQQIPRLSPRGTVTQLQKLLLGCEQ
jgi:hypothetical protein